MTDLPAAALDALMRAVAEYEPQATAAVIASPKQLLSVLLEAARRGLEAAAPHITAAAWRDGYAQGRDDEAAGLPLKEEPAMTSNTPAPAGNHGSLSTVLPDPATENEGFRAYKAGLTAGRAEGAAAERERILKRAEDSPHRVETGCLHCQEDGFRWPCRTARWLEERLREDTP